MPLAAPVMHAVLPEKVEALEEIVAPRGHRCHQISSPGQAANWAGRERKKTFGTLRILASVLPGWDLSDRFAQALRPVAPRQQDSFCIHWLRGRFQSTLQWSSFWAGEFAFELGAVWWQ
jgi:hypothetical protein